MKLDTSSHESTIDMSNLQSGDLLLALNDVDQGEIDPRKGISGHCRIVHCDKDFNPKGQLWTGEQGLVVGLIFNPASGCIYATNPKENSFYEYHPDGSRQDINDYLPKRRFGNMQLAKNGDIVIGVHSLHGKQTVDHHGEGKLVRFNPQSKTFSFYEVEIDGGRGGKHCVSNLAIDNDDTTIYYASEAGQRLSRYNTETDQQLPDFSFAHGVVSKTYGMAILPDGRMLMAGGNAAALFDQDGRTIRGYDVSYEKGWTRAKLALDGQHFYLSNFWNGIIQRRDIETGAITTEVNTGLGGSLLSITEIP